MTNNLRRNRRPFSLEDSLCELNLSISEFVDFVRWANVSTVVPIPHDRTVRMFYENENFSLTPSTIKQANVSIRQNIYKSRVRHSRPSQ